MKYFIHFFDIVFSTWLNRLLLIMLGISLYFQVITLPAMDECQIKSRFLYNLTHFITWPNSIKNDNTPFQICIFGPNNLIDTMLKNHPIHNHSLTIKRLVDFVSLPGCHILYISQSEQLTQIFYMTKNYPILTVSDMKDFIVAGGMIQFIKENNKIRLAINPKALKKVQLKPAANLLRLSTIIEIP